MYILFKLATCKLSLKACSPAAAAGVEVTLVDANHCPGAVQFLFKLATGETYIHCGDMRFGQHLLGDPHLQRFRGCTAIFLDTTYLNPRHTFPPQVGTPWSWHVER